MRKVASAALASASALAVALVAPGVRAAGYDTPILYSARHQGMGGTAIAYVDDPSATFHNPAGLSGVRGLALLGDLSLILGKVQSTPEVTITSEESEPVLAPFFLLAAGYRVHEWLTLGLGFFPVASGGAEYHYDLVGNEFVDRTRLLFLEVTPTASLNVPKDAWIPGELALGAGYRMSSLSFQREKGLPSDPRVLNLDMSGWSFSGFRVGAQYHPIPAFGVGVVFRNRIEIEARADEVSVFTQTATDASLPFILPAKLGGGVELELERWRFAFDTEYAFQSQNDRVELEGTLNGSPSSAPNVFDWKNGVTLRTGVEYRILGGKFRYPLRVGYAFDSAVASRAYPSAFGTPPAPTHIVSTGGGFDAGLWQVNAAVTRRFGSTTIDEDELGEGCSFCAYEGDYALTMTGFYLDASVDFEL
jgi:long-chain fatty acid transport protein